MDDQVENPSPQPPKVEPIWGVAANVVQERRYGPGGKEIKRGTIKFSGGAKVYVAKALWDRVNVVGHFRGNHRYVTSTVNIEYVEKFRAELIYSPAVISRIYERLSSETEAQKLAETLNQKADFDREERRKHLEHRELERKTKEERANQMMTETRTTLTEQLHHPDQNVRSAAALALGKQGDIGALDALLQTLSIEPDLFVREDIIWAIVRLGEAAIQPLIAHLSDPNPAMRHHAAHTLGKIGDARAVKPLMNALGDEDVTVVSKAAFALGQIGDERALPVLVGLVGHEHPEVQASLSHVLEGFGAKAVPPLIQALKDARWEVREQAADILGALSGEDAITALIEALHDEVWQVRFAAVAALGQQGGEEAWQALEATKDDSDAHVRGLVPKVLRRMKV